ncbi:MAG: hypothetical protein FJY18_02925 [Bacteroidetes bacterium]|nr:hypothetical protein [Bacteroidota bacterium]
MVAPSVRMGTETALASPSPLRLRRFKHETTQLAEVSRKFIRSFSTRAVKRAVSTRAPSYANSVQGPSNAHSVQEPPKKGSHEANEDASEGVGD